MIQNDDGTKPKASESETRMQFFREITNIVLAAIVISFTFVLAAFAFNSATLG